MEEDRKKTEQVLTTISTRLHQGLLHCIDSIIQVIPVKELIDFRIYIALSDKLQLVREFGSTFWEDNLWETDQKEIPNNCLAYFKAIWRRPDLSQQNRDVISQWFAVFMKGNKLYIKHKKYLDELESSS